MPLLTAAGAHLYGRRSYELFRGVFTGPEAPPHAELMTDMPKLVVSTTLDCLDWGPTRVIRDDAVATLTRLKEQPGRDIAVGTSGTLVRFLLHEGLLDELRLFVHPVIVGHGRRLFERDDQNIPLTLAQARAHKNGVVALRFTLGRGTVAPTSSEVSQCAS